MAGPPIVFLQAYAFPAVKILPDDPKRTKGRCAHFSFHPSGKNSPTATGFPFSNGCGCDKIKGDLKSVFQSG